MIEKEFMNVVTWNELYDEFMTDEVLVKWTIDNLQSSIITDLLSLDDDVQVKHDGIPTAGHIVQLAKIIAKVRLEVDKQ